MSPLIVFFSSYSQHVLAVTLLPLLYVGEAFRFVLVALPAFAVVAVMMQSLAFYYDKCYCSRCAVTCGHMALSIYSGTFHVCVEGLRLDL